MADIPFFPPLYGSSSHGKNKVWSITVTTRDGCGVITQMHGYVDGKQISNERIITAGKNIGKKNATTPILQAISEATSLWNKKKDSGYVTKITVVEEVAVPLPMLAHDYNKRGKSIIFPCLAQRKLDGVRCLAISGRGLFSRNGKQQSNHLKHIIDEVNTLPSGTILDGELYSDTLTFQEIVGLVKKETLRNDDYEKINKIYLCVYDTIKDGNNMERNTWLSALFTTNSFHSLRLLESVMCESHDALKTLHDNYVSTGYEGLILRNLNGVYKIGHRSTDLQKYKEFEDSEYTVIGFKEGDGVEKGCVLWICKTTDGKEFAVRPRGTHAERKIALESASSMIGQPLTVRYQELTDDGIPRFPVGIAFRTYE
jgi:DNA ligase-1